MKFWIVTIYEPLPFGDRRTRPQRCGMLAKALLDRGHDVELWTSTFDHISHTQLHDRSLFVNAGERISIQFIKGCGYPDDHSLKRFLHNRQTGREFNNLSGRRKERPDIIFAPVPVLELAEAAVKYADKQKIPVIVDVRDLWPDIYLTIIPKRLHFLAKKLLYSEYKRARFVFKKATGITAISNTYLHKGLSYAGRCIRDTDHVFPLGSGEIINSISQRSNTTSDPIYRQISMVKNKFVVTFVGTFSKFLDVQAILEAAKLLTSKPNVHIFIIGTGSRSQEYLKIASRLPNVTMTGWLNSTDISSILKITKVGLVAYSEDAIMSLPNKPFEYMAAGLPILSSLPGELAELIQVYNIGRNYNAGDPVSLSREIQGFYEHPIETKKMGENSMKLFLVKYRSDIIYTEFSEHLERIVNRYDERSS